MQPQNHIGQYKIIKLLGKGGMGVVWLGEHVLLGRRAAIKTLLPNLSAQTEIVDRFFNEAKATAAISDPGVVQIYDFGYHVDGTAYIVMELLEGEALCDRMERVGPLPLVHALRIVRQIAGAMAAAHDVGIVHRDIKPENIFLISDVDMPGGERAKILDFGICKFDDLQCPRKTQTGTMLGTPVYMSPEQCRGSSSVDERSDIYALGCVLFHMLTDRTPFEATGSGEYIVAHLNDEPPPPSSKIAGMTPEVDALVLRCMEKEPIDRYQKMRELQWEIDRILESLGGIAPTDVEPAPRAMKLASGFRSNYDANMDQYTPNGTRAMATPRERPAPELVVTRTPITVPDNAGAWKFVGRTVATASVLALAAVIGLWAHDFAEAGGASSTVAALKAPQEPVAAAPGKVPTTAATQPTQPAASQPTPPSETVAATPATVAAPALAQAPTVTVEHDDGIVAYATTIATTGLHGALVAIDQPIVVAVAPPPPVRQIDRRARVRRERASIEAPKRASRDPEVIPQDVTSSKPQAPSLQEPTKTTPEDLYDTR